MNKKVLVGFLMLLPCVAVAMEEEGSSSYEKCKYVIRSVEQGVKMVRGRIKKTVQCAYDDVDVDDKGYLFESALTLSFYLDSNVFLVGHMVGGSVLGCCCGGPLVCCQVQALYDWYKLEKQGELAQKAVVAAEMSKDD